jgi:hypothetical protein
MRKLLSTLIGTMLLVSAVTQALENKVESPKDFKYESSGFSCKVDKNGSIHNLKIGDTVVIKESLLHGRYKIIKGEKHDQRFFQQYEKNHPFKLKKTGNNTYLLEKKGTLSNKKHKPGANYTEKISFSPNKITFEYEIEMLVPLASQSGIFCSLTYLPLDTFMNKGFKLTTPNGKDKLMVFPQNYSKTSELHINAKSIKVSLGQEIFEVTAGTGSGFFLSDTRSYKGNAFRIDVVESVPWKHKAIEFPVGKKFKWSFELVCKRLK